MSYTIIEDEGIVIRDSDNKIVSPAQSFDDPDFQTYNTWANTPGNTPTIIASRGGVPPIVPEVVTMRQARLALLAVGKLADVTAAINSLPSPEKEAAQIEWEFSTTVVRTHGLVEQLSPVLGFTSEELDSLFLAAASY